MKFYIVRLLSVLFSISICSVLLWHYYNHSYAASSTLHKITHYPAPKKPPTSGNPSIDKLLYNFNTRWEKQEETINSFRSSLSERCNGIHNALVTQENSPLGTNISYDASRKILLVTPELFNIFPKENPLRNAPWDSCSVVGNGGILANSSCGKQIDSASFVIRCNLPPLNNGHEKDTGEKTSFVTANPSILYQKYRGLNRPAKKQTFVEAMHMYGNSLIMFPAFSYSWNTGVSMRALNSLKNQTNNTPQPVFFNPKYLRCLARFWHGRGVRSARLSSGLMMVSLGLELCNTVHLYGFWPFPIHPYNYQNLTNHYYDNRPVNRRVHSMPSEFKALLNLHEQGMAHLHLGECRN